MIHNDNVIVIQKIKEPNTLDNNQLDYIQKVLEKSCTGNICISRQVLFENLKEHLNLNIEQYQFEQEITKAIRSGKIRGFKTRSGRNGGICRVDAFVKKIKAKKKPSHTIPVTQNEITRKLKFINTKIINLVNEERVWTDSDHQALSIIMDQLNKI